MRLKKKLKKITITKTKKKLKQRKT